MGDSNTLSMHREVAISLCPDIKILLQHESDITASTWQKGIETGKSIELVSLCALAESFRLVGCQVIFPDLFNLKPDLFYLRNVIPRHHGAQAGHDARMFDSISIEDRFLGAMTPKAIVRIPNGREFLIFREGYPIHLINWITEGKAEYLDRPDILIAEGSLHLEWEKPNIIEFYFSIPEGTCHGKLRVKNDIVLPLISFQKDSQANIPVNTIIECSVGKGKIVAEEQLHRYLNLFNAPTQPTSILINGRKKGL